MLVVVLGIPAGLVGIREWTGLPDGGSPAADLPVRVWVDAERRLRVMSLEDYVRGVVAAEMPASFHPEALKAQAVVARTYTVRRLRALGGPGCPAHPEADVCTDPRTGQAFATPELLRRKWGPLRYLYYLQKIAAAVDATRGLILTYGGAPADAVYHAASGGRTEDAVAVWGRAVPYLVSVPSPYETSPRLTRTVRVSLDRLAERLGLDRDAVAAAARAGTLIRVTRTSATGRVLRVRVAGREFTGADLRQRLDLPSTLFRATVEGDAVVFQVRGYGHGVGMSQYGADGMARRGADFRAILRHYYPGVEIRPIFLD